MGTGQEDMASRVVKRCDLMPESEGVGEQQEALGLVLRDLELLSVLRAHVPTGVALTLYF